MKKSNIIKLVMVVGFVGILLWSMFGIRANASERAENSKREYRMQEAEFKCEIRNGLEKLGYYNAGITVTKIMDEDGSREYSVMVLHQDLDVFNQEKTDEAYSALYGVKMNAENITVNYTIF